MLFIGLLVLLDPGDRAECISASRTPRHCIALDTVFGVSVIDHEILLWLVPILFLDFPNNS